MMRSNAKIVVKPQRPTSDLVKNIEEAILFYVRRKTKCLTVEPSNLDAHIAQTHKVSNRRKQDIQQLKNCIDHIKPEESSFQLAKNVFDVTSKMTKGILGRSELRKRIYIAMNLFDGQYLSMLQNASKIPAVNQEIKESKKSLSQAEALLERIFALSRFEPSVKSAFHERWQLTNDVSDCEVLIEEMLASAELKNQQKQSFRQAWALIKNQYRKDSSLDLSCKNPKNSVNPTAFMQTPLNFEIMSGYHASMLRLVLNIQQGLLAYVLKKLKKYKEKPTHLTVEFLQDCPAITKKRQTEMIQILTLLMNKKYVNCRLQVLVSVLIKQTQLIKTSLIGRSELRDIMQQAILPLLTVVQDGKMQLAVREEAILSNSDEEQGILSDSSNDQESLINFSQQDYREEDKKNEFSEYNQTMIDDKTELSTKLFRQTRVSANQRSLAQNFLDRSRSLTREDAVFFSSAWNKIAGSVPINLPSRFLDHESNNMNAQKDNTARYRQRR